MILTLAARNLGDRPWRSALLLLGYAVGVAVMIVLLAVGEALLIQARDEKLVGGGSITVLPEGLDVEVMKTGGVGGMYLSIDRAQFVTRQLLASPRLAGAVTAVAPQIDGKLLYLRRARITGGGDTSRSVAGRAHASFDMSAGETTRSGAAKAHAGSDMSVRGWYPVRARGEIPSATRAVGGSRPLVAGAWEDDARDSIWLRPTAKQLAHQIDHFHMPPDSIPNRETWAEWHYANVLSRNGQRWAFITLMVAGDVGRGQWGGQVLVTVREAGGKESRYVARVDSSRVRFSTTSADVVIGDSHVRVRDNGTYEIVARAPAERGTGAVRIRLALTPEPMAYFPGTELSTDDSPSGYAVAGLRARASGTLCVEGECETLTDVPAYKDHNWGTWRGVTWEWGAASAGTLGILYGRVHSSDQSAPPGPLFVYLVDSLGYRAVFRPRSIMYEDMREITIGGRRVRVPTRAVMTDARGDDSLDVELFIEDATGTDIRGNIGGRDTVRLVRPYFIQMKGVAKVRGRALGASFSGEGTGFFETFRAPE